MHEEINRSHRYIGRFAPTPSGPLHFGSLIAAVGSYLDAHAHQGEWQLRIDDIDQPRTAPGATEAILKALEGFGFEWSGPVVYQSQRIKAYEQALEILEARAHLYACACTRKDIAEQGSPGHYGPIYPGTCRNGIQPDQSPRALRCLTTSDPVCLDDRLQGRYCQQLENEIGDFVVRRADNIIAYQLATVVDDADQQVTDIVRGVDLLDSTPRQIHLQNLLGLPTPRYLHLPIAVNDQHEKLSKQTHARPLDTHHCVQQLFHTLVFLNQTPPAELARASLEELWNWAKQHWSTASLPQKREIIVSED
jgi:glutamyl-Q tRNA(Asp) synthetase